MPSYGKAHGVWLRLRPRPIPAGSRIEELSGSPRAAEEPVFGVRWLRAIGR